MQQQQVRPSVVAPVSNLEVLDVKTSSAATVHLMIYSISYILKHRGIYPPEAFLERIMRKGEFEPVVLKQLSDDCVSDDVRLGISTVLNLLHDTFIAVAKGEVLTLMIQLHNGEDDSIVEEEWIFDIKYKAAATDKVSPTQPTQSQDLFPTLMQPTMTHDRVLDVFSTALHKLDSAVRSLKPFEFDNPDHADHNTFLGVSLFLKDTAEWAPVEFEKLAAKRDAGRIEDVTKHRIGSFYFPYHEVVLKLRTNRREGGQPR